MKRICLSLFVILIAPALGYCQRRDSSLVHFFAGAGINSGNSRIIGDAQFSDARSNTTITPVFNFGADMLFSEDFRALFFKANLGLTQNRVSFLKDGSNGTPYTADYNFTQKTISANAQFVYNLYDSKAFKFYLAFGGAVNFHIYSNVDHTIDFHTGVNEQTSTALNPIPLTPVSFNISGSAGILLNSRIEIYFKDVPLYTLTYLKYDNNVTVTSSYFQAGISYFY